MWNLNPLYEMVVNKAISNTASAFTKSVKQAAAKKPMTIGSGLTKQATAPLRTPMSRVSTTPSGGVPQTTSKANTDAALRRSASLKTSTATGPLARANADVNAEKSILSSTIPPNTNPAAKTV